MQSTHRIYCFLLYIFACLPIGCIERNEKPLEIVEAPVKVHDTNVAPDTEPIVPIMSRVAWQKPSLILDRLSEELSHKKIADIGAGPDGFFTFWMAQEGADVIAVDIDPEALKYIEQEKANLDSTRQSRITTRLARPDDPNLRAAEVDGILIVNTIAFIQNRSKYLNLLKTKLKEGGKIVIVDFKMNRLPAQIAPPKSQRIAPDVVEELLYQAGYHHIVVDDQELQYQYIVTAEK